ncbi:MarR family transcriptional regulator [Streptomyces mirabilis]
MRSSPAPRSAWLKVPEASTATYASWPAGVAEIAGSAAHTVIDSKNLLRSHSELARVSGQHEQVIGSLVDDLERLGHVERKPGPRDRHAKALGQQECAAFKTALHRVADLQRKVQHDSRGARTRSGRPGHQ